MKLRFASSLNMPRPQVISAMPCALKKDFRQALDLCNRAIALDAGYAQAYNNRGTILTELDRHNDALADYAMAVKLQPELSYAHSNLGNAFMRLDRPDKALRHYKQALSVNPDAPDILNHLGACPDGYRQHRGSRHHFKPFHRT